MAIVILQLPEVNNIEENRPQKCPYCTGDTFQRWGGRVRKVKDPQIKEVVVYRYRCCRCKRTFRHNPKGVSRAQQSERMKKLAAISWSRGLSHRGVSLILTAFGLTLSHMSSWRDVQAAGEIIQRQMQWRPARIVGVDGAWLNGKGIMVAVDLGNGQLISIAQIDEKDAPALREWLFELKQKHGITAIVTDDLSTYRPMTEDLGLDHQICQFHVRRWVGRARHQLAQKLPEEWLWVLEEIKHIMEDMPPDSAKRLLQLYQKLPGNLKQGQVWSPLDELRHLLIRLSESWSRYTTFFHDAAIPWTNNLSEQAIGGFKMRARTVRGYKSPSGMHNGLLVSAYCFS
jgi:transposase-like protein